MSYDAKEERYHVIAAGIAGCLDGHLPRARFFGDDYLPRRLFRKASSPDGLYDLHGSRKAEGFAAKAPGFR